MGEDLLDPQEGDLPSLLNAMLIKKDDELATLRQALDKSQTECVGVKEYVLSLQRQIREREMQLEEARRELEGSNSLVVVEQRKVRELTSSQSALRHKYEQLLEAHEQVQQKKCIKSDVSKWYKPLASTSSPEVEQVATLQKQVRDLLKENAKVSRESAQTDELKRAVAASKAEADHWRQKHDDMQGQIDMTQTISQHLSRTIQQTHSLTGELEDRDKTISELRERLATSEAELLEVRSDYHNLRRAIGVSDADMDVVNLLEDNAAKLKASQEESERITQQLTKTLTQLDNYKSLVEVKQNEITDLKAEFADSKLQMKDWEERVTLFTDQTLDLQLERQERTRVEERCRSLTHELEALKAELVVAKDESEFQKKDFEIFEQMTRSQRLDYESLKITARTQEEIIRQMSLQSDHMLGQIVNSGTRAAGSNLLPQSQPQTTAIMSASDSGISAALPPHQDTYQSLSLMLHAERLGNASLSPISQKVTPPPREVTSTNPTDGARSLESSTSSPERAKGIALRMPPRESLWDKLKRVEESLSEQSAELSQAKQYLARKNRAHPPSDFAPR